MNLVNALIARTLYEMGRSHIITDFGNSRRKCTQDKIHELIKGLSCLVIWEFKAVKDYCLIQTDDLEAVQVSHRTFLSQTTTGALSAPLLHSPLSTSLCY